MTPAQQKLYWREWAKARDALIHYGRTPAQAKDERKALHIRALGKDVSSKALTNAQLTKVLMQFWVWSRAADLRAQLRADTEAARLGKFACRQIIAMAREIVEAAGLDVDLPDSDAYLEKIFHDLNHADPEKPVDANDGTHDQWHKVMLACCYRYDQVTRKALGLENRKDLAKFWPTAHWRTLPDIIARHPDQQPLNAWQAETACSDNGNPF